MTPECILLWARPGLKKIVCVRGTLFSIFHPTLIVKIGHSRSLRGLLCEDDLGYTDNFPQMYVTLLHSHPKNVHVHPVGGCIVNCGLCYPKHGRAREEDNTSVTWRT